jgi:hypothetical protein
MAHFRALQILCAVMLLALPFGAEAQYSFSGVLTTASATTISPRYFRASPPSSCAAPKAFPGTTGSGNFAYSTYSAANPGPSACVTVTFSSNNCSSGNPDIFIDAYADYFNASSLSTNYLGDSGGSIGSAADPSISFSVLVPAGKALILVPSMVPNNAASPVVGCSFSITTSGLPAIPAKSDINGDRKSDIIWRRSSGEVYAWLMNGTGGSGGALSTVPDANWKIAGVGDYDGNGKADILWRHAVTGQNYVWLMNGISIASGGYLSSVPDTNWQIQGTGDWDGDGKADILWRHAVTGQVYVWLMNGFTVVAGGSVGTVSDLNWRIQGTGDYDGDGQADVLWRHAVTGQAYLWLSSNVGDGSPGTVPDLNWQIQGTGDWDGDGKADILWRHAVTGQVYVWLMNGFTVVAGGSVGTVPDTNWQIQGTGDYDGDGEADIFWYHALTGQTYVWLSSNLPDGSAGTVPDLNWQIQNPK